MSCRPFLTWISATHHRSLNSKLVITDCVVNCSHGAKSGRRFLPAAVKFFIRELVVPSSDILLIQFLLLQCICSVVNGPQLWLYQTDPTCRCVRAWMTLMSCHRHEEDTRRLWLNSQPEWKINRQSLKIISFSLYISAYRHFSLRFKFI